MASALESPTAEVPNRLRAACVAHIEIYQDMNEAGHIWRALEKGDHFSTPFQRFDFLATWQRHIGEREGLRPFIVVGYDADHRPVMLLPLAVKKQAGVRVAKFLGGKHATFNMPMWRRDFVSSTARADLDKLVLTIGEHSENVDMLLLTRQPQRWMGLVNPMSMLSNQVSANDCPLMTIAPQSPPSALISNSFRRRLKGKERKLQALPGFCYRLARTDADVKRVLDAFFITKPARMAAQKLPNVFANPGVEEFIREACMTPVAGGGYAIDVHSLECDDEVIAIFAGVADGDRFSMMFNTYTMSDNSRYSPGLILMRDIIDYYASNGYGSLDLGVGSDDYKRLFCKSDEPIFDSFVPLTTRGKAVAIGMSSMTSVKRLVKQTPALM